MRTLTLPRRIGLLEERCDHARNHGQRKRMDMLSYGLSILNAELSARIMRMHHGFVRTMQAGFSRN